MKVSDSRQRELVLAPPKFQGGEGTIHEHPREAGRLIKIYREPTAAKAAKVEALIQIGRNAGEKFHQIATWPMEVILAGGRPVGFVMRQVEGVPIHTIYSPKERKNLYPDLTWKKLVVIARNAAAAFYQLHAAGAVLGDVNEGNFLVDPKTGLVSLIDCDSYQITYQGIRHLCPVGVGIWTPPELHGLDFKLHPRTPNHDNFGLAVLLFQLIFIGRHPFASPHQGDLDDAIRQRLFTYADAVSSRGIRPPPLTLLEKDVGAEIFQLFERAFLAGSEWGSAIVPCPSCGQKNRVPRVASGTIRCGQCSSPFPAGWREQRPLAGEWFTALRTLETSLATCAKSPLHHHLSGRECPFCALDEAGYSAFTPAGFAHKGEISMEELVRVMGEIEGSQVPVFTSAGYLAAVTVPPPAVPRINRLFLAGCILAATAALLLFLQLYIAGAFFAIGAVALLGTGTETRAYQELRRTTRQELGLARADLAEGEAEFREWLAQHREKLDAAKRKAAVAYRELLEIPVKQRDAIQELERQRRPRQLRAHLEKHPCPRYFFDSFALGLDVKLQAAGVRNAWDVLSQARPPGIPSDLWLLLSKWAREKQDSFVFDHQESIPASALLALRNRLDRERREGQMIVNESFQTARLITGEAKGQFDARRAEMVRLARLVQEAEARLQALG